MENKVYIIDRCDYLVEAFFKNHFPECEVEDGERILHLSGKSYDIIMLEPFGIPTQRDLQFYILKEYIKS
jgi:hypothetical protein